MGRSSGDLGTKFLQTSVNASPEKKLSSPLFTWPMGTSANFPTVFSTGLTRLTRAVSSSILDIDSPIMCEPARLPLSIR